MEPETQDALFCRSQRTRDDFTVLSTKGYFIKTIEHDLWECVSSITSMDLCCNEIEEIPYSLPIATPHLKYLDISSNKITRLPESIGQWKMMICFILETGSGKNMIKNLPDSMKNMKDLKGFKATSCGIEYIPPGLFATSIETINLCNNRLTHFRPSLFAGKLTSLKFLDLSRNANLELSEDLPAYIPNVELVMVGNNKAIQTENSIKSLPASMKNMTKLEKFDASNSSITHLEPNAFSPSLIDIDLSSNRLECIKESAFSCSAERIDLRLNQISFIEACSFGSSIKHINLRSNRLSRLDSTMFTSLPSDLETLDLTFNDITEIPEEMPMFLPKLKYLSFAYNPLKKLPETIGLWKNPETLTPSNNIITLANSFAEMTMLTSIDLTGCKIKRLGPNLFGPSLESIHLQNNEISELSAEPFANCMSLANLSLTNNKIRYIYDSFVQYMLHSKLKYLSVEKNELLVFPREFIKSRSIDMYLGLNPFYRSRMESNNENLKPSCHISFEEILHLPAPNTRHHLDLSTSCTGTFCEKDGDLIDAFHRSNYSDSQDKRSITRNFFINCNHLVLSLKEIALRSVRPEEISTGLSPHTQRLMKKKQRCYVCKQSFFDKWIAFLKWESFRGTRILCKAKVCSYQCYKKHMGIIDRFL